jgi:hypothetical protein
MLSGMQSLLDLGVCREMPVVGFINGVLILGIIVSSSLSLALEQGLIGRMRSLVNQSLIPAARHLIKWTQNRLR